MEIRLLGKEIGEICEGVVDFIELVSDADAVDVGVVSIFLFYLGGGVGGARVDEEMLGGVHFVVADDCRPVVLLFMEVRELIDQELPGTQERGREVAHVDRVHDVNVGGVSNHEAEVFKERQVCVRGLVWHVGLRLLNLDQKEEDGPRLIVWRRE